MIFRFIDKFISNNVGRKFEANYCNIYTEKHEANFFNLDIKIRIESFKLVLAIKK